MLWIFVIFARQCFSALLLEDQRTQQESHILTHNSSSSLVHLHLFVLIFYVVLILFLCLYIYLYIN